jgi:anti-sigma factor RsiW
MASNFDARNDFHQQFSMDLPTQNEEDCCLPLNTMDNLKRDRFELLSAYLDGEVTAAERHQIEDWLVNDPSVQCLYARLLKLRSGMRSLSVPVASRPVDQVVDQVMNQVDRRPKLTLMWGGAAAAAILLGLLSDLTPSHSGSPQQQYSSHPPVVEAESYPSVNPVNSNALMIALDRPIIEIPNASATGTAH